MNNYDQTLAQLQQLGLIAPNPIVDSHAMPLLWLITLLTQLIIMIARLGLSTYFLALVGCYPAYFWLGFYP